METRVAVISIIVEDAESVAALNELLHEYGEYVIGRMGIPYRAKNINIISIAIDAPQDVISALSGKIGPAASASCTAFPPRQPTPRRTDRRIYNQNPPDAETKLRRKTRTEENLWLFSLRHERRVFRGAFFRLGKETYGYKQRAARPH